MNITTVDFMGLRLARITVREFISEIMYAAKARSPLLTTYLNAHCSNIAARADEYRRILESADLLYADGKAVVWASRLLNSPIPERVSAGDFFIEFCNVCAEQRIHVYLLGSYPEVAERVSAFLGSHVPNLRIAGVRHGFIAPADEQAVISGINSSGADILIVGMGVPLQEKFVARHRDALEPPVIWCVGALFEYVGGYRKRAPVWVRKIGMEWFVRLALEPRRLWKRYILGNPRFVARVLKYTLRRGK